MPSERDYIILSGGSQVYAVGGPFQYQSYGRSDIPDGDYFTGWQNRTDDGRTALVLDREDFIYIDDIRVRGTIYVSNEFDTYTKVIPKLCARIQDATSATLTSQCYSLAVQVTDSDTPEAYVHICKGDLGDSDYGDILDSSSLVIHNVLGLGDVPTFGLELRVYDSGSDAVIEVYQAMVTRLASGVYAESYNFVMDYTDSSPLGPGGVGFAYNFTEDGIDATSIDAYIQITGDDVEAASIVFDEDDLGKLLLIDSSLEGNNGSYLISALVDASTVTVTNLGGETVSFSADETNLEIQLYNQGKAVFDSILYDNDFDFSS